MNDVEYTLRMRLKSAADVLVILLLLLLMMVPGDFLARSNVT